jgi:D-serine deaminase-like pyridoxal phosphate-dependent protein
VYGADQTGNDLNVTGYAPFATNVLHAGDYLQLSSGATTRLHMVLDDADANSSGDAVLTIWPTLRESPSDGAAVIVTGAKGLFRAVGNVNIPDVNHLGLYGLTFAFREAL